MLSRNCEDDPVCESSLILSTETSGAAAGVAVHIEQITAVGQEYDVSIELIGGREGI